MRTTVDIPDPIYRELKAKAAREGSTVKAIVLRGVEDELGKPRVHRKKRVTLPLVKSKRPGWLKLTNERVNDLILP